MAVYRDKKGRFASYRQVMFGPHPPIGFYINRALNRRSNIIMDLVMQASPVYKFMKQRGMVVKESE